MEPLQSIIDENEKLINDLRKSLAECKLSEIKLTEKNEFLIKDIEVQFIVFIVFYLRIYLVKRNQKIKIYALKFRF